ncbi:transposase [Mesorhizobium escarrei]|uniref:Transposase n=2 Tax=Mesorhizobium escarrei TaxID=666018 RepID=A0ABM9EF60_9HYPH|nr:transposase [Mesorhizobium escarrei]
MSETEAYAHFTRLRFAESGGEPVCPRCGCAAVWHYRCRRAFKCKNCDRQFSPTSGTAFAHRKMRYGTILRGIARFVGPAKGLNSIELSHALCVQQKTAFVFGHKLRELTASNLDEISVAGEVEVDGAEFGGHLRPKNVKKRSTDFRKFPYRNSAKKRNVVVARERHGNAVVNVSEGEAASLPFIYNNVTIGSMVFADSAACWNILNATYRTKRINHREAYYTTEASTNWAESYFSVLRRSAFGIYHRPSMKYLVRYASEIAWRQNTRKEGALKRFDDLIGTAGRRGRSSFSGYWQRHRQRETS